jgi:hypothetical protein
MIKKKRIRGKPTAGYKPQQIPLGNRGASYVKISNSFY